MLERQTGQRVMIDNRQRGFTLVEFLVAIVILMVGMLGLLQSINIAMNTNVESMLRNEATMLVDERMMNKRALAFELISSSSKTLVTHNVRGIFCNYSVQDVVTVPTPQSKEIVISATWKRKNKSYSHSVSTVVSKFKESE